MFGFRKIFPDETRWGEYKRQEPQFPFALCLRPGAAPDVFFFFPFCLEFFFLGFADSCDFFLLEKASWGIVGYFARLWATLLSQILLVGSMPNPSLDIFDPGKSKTTSPAKGL